MRRPGEFSRRLEPKMIVGDFTIAAGENRNFEPEFSDATAGAV